MEVDQLTAKFSFLVTGCLDLDFIDLNQRVVFFQIGTIKHLAYIVKGQTHDMTIFDVLRIKPEKLEQQYAK